MVTELLNSGADANAQNVKVMLDLCIYKLFISQVHMCLYICVRLWEKGPFCANNRLALCMKIASWVGFERFLNSVSTVSRKAYLAYHAGVRSLHAHSWKPIALS